MFRQTILSTTVPSGGVSLAGCAHDNQGSSIRTIHLAFILASVVSLLPPYFALPFDPDASFQSVVGWLRSDRNGEDKHCRISDGTSHYWPLTDSTSQSTKIVSPVFSIGTM